MMKKNKNEKISEVLKDMISGNSHFSRKFRQRNIEEIWRETFGPTISKYTNKISMKGDVLTVHITSAALRNDLLYSKDTLLKKLNSVLEYRKVKEIIVR